jgi:exonuclease VII small subunit
MDMEEALDNLSLNFRNIDTETLREILEEANGDYEQAVSLCKQAIFEGRL